jgi:hypothetical protein
MKNEKTKVQQRLYFIVQPINGLSRNPSVFPVHSSLFAILVLTLQTIHEYDSNN